MTNSKYIASANVKYLLLIKFVFDDVGVLLVQKKMKIKFTSVRPSLKGPNIFICSTFLLSRFLPLSLVPYNIVGDALLAELLRWRTSH